MLNKQKDQIITDLSECYEWAQREFGDNFERIMAEVAINVIDLQYQTKNMTFNCAAMCLCMPEQVQAQDQIDYNRTIKACIVWNVFNLKYE